MKYTIWLLPLAVAVAVGCSTTGANTPKTQLEIREFQTRTYPTNDVKLVMKAMLNVLQDDGYIVKNAATDLGLLNAQKEVNVENKGEAVLSMLVFRNNAKWKKNSIIDATANVSEFGTECKVRVNFQVKTLDNTGNVIERQAH